MVRKNETTYPSAKKSIHAANTLTRYQSHTGSRFTEKWVIITNTHLLIYPATNQRGHFVKINNHNRKIFVINEYKFIGGSILYNLFGTAKKRSITSR